MKKLALLPFVLFFVLTGISQTTTGSFLYKGVIRNYIVYKPTINNGTKPVPLVLNLHGYTSNASDQFLYTQFDKIADTANFIIVCPNGISNSWNSGWNVPYSSGTDDVGFLSALIDTIQSHYSIDANRIYSTGMSNGGFMSFRLACELSNKIAAIASVTGLMSTGQTQNCNPARKVPVLFIHGTNDPTVAYNGSLISISADSTFGYWKSKNSCSGSASFSSFQNKSTTDGCTAERYTYSSCGTNSEVDFIKIVGGGHTWPGAPIDISSGPTNHDFSASEEIWKFFLKHSLTGFVSLSSHEKAANNLVLYPNPSDESVSITLASSDYFAYSIVDVAGKVVFSGKNFSSSITIDTNELVSGLYFLTVQTTNSLYSKRFIITH